MFFSVTLVVFYAGLEDVVAVDVVEGVEVVVEVVSGDTRGTSMLFGDTCTCIIYLEYLFHCDKIVHVHVHVYSSDFPPPPLIRPIFDWSEVGEIFPPASSRVDYSLLHQVQNRGSCTRTG